MVWLGVDLGDAWVGLALSDPELTLAHPAGNITVNGDPFHALDAVVDIIEDESVDHVVVGLPLLMDGTDGRSAKKARRWARNLERRMHALAGDGQFDPRSIATVTLLDERLTTVSAHRQLIEAGVGTRRHRPMVDQQSAVVILQTALEQRDGRGGTTSGRQFG